MTFIFNVFVLFQLFNGFNCRKLQDEIWVLSNIVKSWPFVLIWFIIFWVQVILIEAGGQIIDCHLDGLTVEQWLICIAWGLLSIV
mmetsp:Transcript_15888/g.15851  ORF Transcript_15888/g.15851 Transcript_15888/m.15851 type:complete len:85 (+) Transcript_15888:2-256(+)